MFVHDMLIHLIKGFLFVRSSKIIFIKVIPNFAKPRCRLPWNTILFTRSTALPNTLDIFIIDQVFHYSCTPQQEGTRDRQIALAGTETSRDVSQPRLHLKVSGKIEAETAATFYGGWSQSRCKTFLNELLHWTKRATDWVHLMISTPCCKQMQFQGMQLSSKGALALRIISVTLIYMIIPLRVQTQSLHTSTRDDMREKIAPDRNLPWECVQ